MNSLIKAVVRLTITVMVLLATSSASCSGLPIKKAPEYPGVDPRAQRYLDEYLWLSGQNHIQFDGNVSIGFRDINDGNVVGFCTYGSFFREIDIDINYWNHSSNTTRMTLLYHELTHCYCERDHDYGVDLKYPPTDAERVAQALEWQIKGGPRPGYWDDGCAVSVMYPVVLDDLCMRTHYQEYAKEMFDRCQPW